MNEVIIIRKDYHNFLVENFERNKIDVKDLNLSDLDKIKNGNYTFYYLERKDCSTLFIKIAGFFPIFSLFMVPKK